MEISMLMLFYLFNYVQNAARKRKFSVIVAEGAPFFKVTRNEMSSTLLELQ